MKIPRDLKAGDLLRLADGKVVKVTDDYVEMNEDLGGSGPYHGGGCIDAKDGDVLRIYKPDGVEVNGDTATVTRIVRVASKTCNQRHKDAKFLRELESDPKTMRRLAEIAARLENQK